MVGIVIVSHSRQLAEGLLALIRQMSSPNVRIAAAAGIGENRTEIGTDAVEIMDAIRSVFSDEGVVVLMDLGSAILSAETAREMLPPEIAEKLCFCAAPIVEGALAAAVQAGLGANLETVCAEARTALIPKQEHLGQGESQSLSNLPTLTLAKEMILTLKNLHGLHARPAARFVQTAVSFDAEVRVRNLTNSKGPVTARSLNGVATLGAVGGHQIGISAHGAEAVQALDALRVLVESGFGEIDLESESISVSSSEKKSEIPIEGAESAIPIAEGFAVGPIYVYRPVPPPISSEKITDADAETAKLQSALISAAQDIRQQKAKLRGSISAEQAAIFDAHVLILQDPETLSAVQTRIRNGENAAYAWNAVAEQTAAEYRALPDPYLQTRAMDVMDVARQVLFSLAGRLVSRIELSTPVILCAQDLTPIETSQLELEKVLGLVTVGGGPTSHSAILARALGIPAVSGVSASVLNLSANTLLGLDGAVGRLWINPPEKVQQNLSAQRAAWLDRRQELLRTSQVLANTSDGTRIEVVANVGNVQDAQLAVKNGAEGIGLLRTEFLFLTRQTPPTEDEQVHLLQDIGAAMGERPVIVRTLDAGGDKELPYAGLAAEANPFLGVRAIRVSLVKPELFQPQLRAILRAALDANFRIMFPMIANIDEVLKAKSALELAHHDLENENTPHRWPIETGIMVEVPSAALMAELLAPHVDFFSIGTNDLTQYTLASERGNPSLAHLSDALHPAVLRLIQQVCAAAEKHNKWVSVCGELGGDPSAIAILIGLGVRELSMTSNSIPKIKQLLRKVSLTDSQSLAKDVLSLTNAESVRERAAQFLASIEG
ncbi:MAG: phosphoenolpyruvate--protein phosphotransferase [Anaerolineae bacterium]|nr:phosphoenolpyruvate--protein phosphotransferase [Anaerolineae bacterium]